MGTALLNRLTPLLCTVIWLSISASAAAQSEPAADEQDGWYIEYSSILANPDDTDEITWDGSFTTFGLGVGYAITPKISVEGRYRVSNAAKVNLGTLDIANEGGVGSTLWELSVDVSYAVAEVAAVYTTPLSNSINFHLRGGIQTYTNDLDKLEAFNRPTNTTIAFPELLAETEDDIGDSDPVWVLGGGISYRIGDRWWIRHEILLEDEGDTTSVGVSFAQFF